MTNVCPHRLASPSSATADLLSSAMGTPLPRPYTTSQLQELQRDLAALAPALAWLDEFVTQANPHLGRPGVVCPFVPEATRRDLLQFFVLPVVLPSGISEARDDDYMAWMEPAILRLRDQFMATRLPDQKLRLLHSYLIVFRGLEMDADRAALLIEKIQRRLKPRFVEEGLMIGEFHPMSNAVGLRNPNFRPLRSPVPLLSMRNMVEIDFAFLSRPYDPAPLRVHFLQSYLRHMSPDLGPLSRRKAEAALQEAESQMAQQLEIPINCAQINEWTATAD